MKFTLPLALGFLGLVLSEKVTKDDACVLITYPNLMTNPGFQTNYCSGLYCIENAPDTSIVPGWVASPSLQLGRALNYNSNLFSNWVVELDVVENSCIYQIIQNTRPLLHTLSFDYMARQGVPFNSTRMSVSINGVVVRNIVGNSFNFRRINIPVNLSSSPSNVQVKFCATGRSDGLGAVVDNFSLTFRDCAPGTS